MNKKTRIALNGFGRIGRGLLRQLLASKYAQEIEVVAINDIGDAAILAHLFEFDSVHGRFNGSVSFSGNGIVIDQQEILIIHVANLEDLNWRHYAPDVVIECTGRFKTESEALLHVKAGAPRVIISAVAQGENIKTIVLGANEKLLDGTEKVISNASCTTNCAAPLVDVIDRHFEIESGYITTVHSYTSDQTLHDRPHNDFRRACAAAL